MNGSHTGLMTCTGCSHPFEQHRLGKAKRCATRIAYGWNEETKAFAGTAPCACSGYTGSLPGHDCPHEYIRESAKCVHCRHVMASGGKSA